MNIDEKYFAPSEADNSLESVLETGEKILFRSKPNKTSYILAAGIKMLPLAIVWLCVDAFFLTFIGRELSRGAMPMSMLGFVIPFFIIHLAPVWMWLYRIIRSTIEIKNIEYAFTDKRIIVRSGVIGIDFKFFYYDKIESVVAKVGFIDRLCKVGDIYITAAGTAGVIFDQKDPYGLATKLEKLATDIRSDLSYPNALRPEQNPGYKTELATGAFEPYPGSEHKSETDEEPFPELEEKRKSKKWR